MGENKSPSGQKRIVLIAVLGTSPAVLTETVWALAHLDEPVIPDEVVAVTTTGGEAALKAQLFGEAKGWDRLLAALSRLRVGVGESLRFGTTRQSIKVFSDRRRQYELADIATTDDNTQAADDLLEILRCYTEDPSTQVYASIAGGRKTMGALMLSCMSLLGREGDHVLHVLVNPPFDGGVEPVFLFPERGVRYTPRAGGPALSAREARISLIDLPFVKMRGWYQDRFKTLPPRYSDLVRAAQSVGPAATVQKPLLTFDFDDGSLFVDEQAVKLSPVEFITLATDLLLAPKDLASTLVKIHGRSGGDFGWLGDFANGYAGGNKFERTSSAKADLTRARSSLRSKFRKEPSLEPFVDVLVPRGSKHGSWPEARISADIPKFKKMVGMV